MAEQITRISDLPHPVTVARQAWLVASRWMGFTPRSDGPAAAVQHQAIINSQIAGGYILEYITLSFGKPNPGYEIDPAYLEAKQVHEKSAGRLIGVHRLSPVMRPLRSILGDTDFGRFQGTWAESGEQRRWSVAFPVVESYEICEKPPASEIFGSNPTKTLFGFHSNSLGLLNDEQRDMIADLELRPKFENVWMEDDIAAAEQSKINSRIARAIDRDLSISAVEGLTKERWTKIRLRAAWLAQNFVRHRQKAGEIFCDRCHLNPAERLRGTQIEPRSLLDVHHLHPLAEGKRATTRDDFELLCPTCHRLEHLLLGRAAKQK